jgi:uncharacterized membrane protein
MELFVIAIAAIALGAPITAMFIGATLWSRVSELRAQLATLAARVDMHSTAGGMLDSRVAAIEAALPGMADARAHSEADRRRSSLAKIARSLAASALPVAPPVEAAPHPDAGEAPEPPVPPSDATQPREGLHSGQTTPFGEAKPLHPTVEGTPGEAPPVETKPVATPPMSAPAGVEPTASKPTATPIAWEQWLGVRGAAALGAAVLILAGIYFFQYSIERGLIGPGLRVTLGALAGAGCIAGAERFVRQRHALLANCLVGAGVALSYLSAWAASAQFALVSHYVAGVAMIGITGLCCWLSVRRASAAIAIFGLLGGFATPVLLSRGADSPIALFSYLLLLDAALLYVAHVQRWPLLAVMSLVGTAAYQSLWIAGSMGPERVGWGMMLCVGFGVVFAVASTSRVEAPRLEPGWGLTRAAAVLLPFGFAFYAGIASSLEVGLAELCAYLGVLLVGAWVVARRDEVPWIGLSGTCAALGVMGAWLLVHPVDAFAVIAFVGLGAVVHAFAELEARRGEISSETALAGVAWNAGAMLVTALAAASAAPIGPWLAGWLALALLGLRLTKIAARPWLALPHGAAAGLGIIALAVGHHEAPSGVALQIFAGALIVAAALHGASRLADRATTTAASALAIFVLAALAVPSWLGAGAHTAALLIASAIAIAGARRHGGPAWLVIANLAAIAAATAGFLHRADAASAYLAHALIALLFVAAPLLLDREARGEARNWRPGALAAVFALVPMVWLHEELFGPAHLGATPMALALLPLGLLLLLGRLGPEGNERRRAATTLGAVAVLLITVALPLELTQEGLTIALAIEALALLALWRRFDHSGLKYAALALFGAVVFRLLQVPEVIDYHPRSDLPIVNWLATTYLVPALCLGLGVLCLRDREAARLRPWERTVGTPLLAAAALVVVFVWLNLTIVDAFADAPRLSLAFDRLPSRDLALSLAWAIYALGLLALGTWRTSRGLRIASLVLMLATCAKVFLGDLAHLEDLHRVMSLVGLAISLIAVSFAYKRFALAESA